MAGRIRTSSFWNEEPAPVYPPLEEDLRTDVAVVGGGLTGVALAHRLASEGADVALVEDRSLGAGETGNTTAHLTFTLDAGVSEILSMFGEEKARMALESHRSAIDLIESNAREEGIACDFQRLDAYLTLAVKDELSTLESEQGALSRLGFRAEISAAAPLPYATGPSLRIPGQAQFHPLKYLYGLAAAAARRGCRIFCGTRAARIAARSVTASNGRKISAQRVVVATHSPVKNPFMFLKEAAYLTYAVAAPVPAGSVPRGLYWDTEDPYHYVRVHPHGDGEVLIAGGEDHKTGQSQDTGEPFRALERWMRERFPQAGEVRWRWSGQVIEPFDALAYIGRSPYRPHGLYVATGYSGNGMTYAHVAAMLLSDLILGRPNPWKDLYEPSRKVLRGGIEMAAENLNAAKRFAADRLKPATKRAEDLEPGEGAIIRRGLAQVAAYRDEKGILHAHSAVCPHLHCVVRWNSAERTFDCPCHGSRFTAEGKVITGPANSDLHPHEIREKTRSRRG